MLRCKTDLSSDELEKVSRLCQIKKDNIIVNYNVPRIYDVPKLFLHNNVHTKIANRLGLLPLRLDVIPDFSYYEKVLMHYHSESQSSSVKIKIGIVGKYTGMQDTYLSLIRALEMAAVDCGIHIDIIWISSELQKDDLEKKIEEVDKIIIPGGFGIRGIEGMISAVEIARQQQKNVLGICLGCQILAIEFARNTVKLEGANSIEFDPNTPHPIIVPCSDTDVLGGTMRLGSIEIHHTSPITTEIYDGVIGPTGTTAMTTSKHRFRHRYVINDKYIPMFSEKGFGIDGLTTSEDHRSRGLVSNISIDYSTYVHIGVQYHPELSPRADPIFGWFLKK